MASEDPDAGTYREVERVAHGERVHHLHSAQEVFHGITRRVSCGLSSVLERINTVRDKVTASRAGRAVFVTLHRPSSLATKIADCLLRDKRDNGRQQTGTFVQAKTLDPDTFAAVEELQESRSAPQLRRQGQTVFDLDQSVLAMCDTSRPPCITNPRVFWRHPALRLINVWLVLLLDFYIYGEDPVQDSYAVYPYFGVFEDFFLAWPEEPVFRASRILSFVLVTIFSLWFGRQVVHHWFLRDLLGLTMFAGEKGVLLINMFMWIGFFEYVLPYPVNHLECTGMFGLVSVRDCAERVPITEDSALRYTDWGKIWQSTAAAFDLVSIVMITDTVLQDRTVWPEWGVNVKRLWNDVCGGWVRIIVAWIAFFGFLPALIFGLYARGGTNGIYETHVVTSKVIPAAANYPTAQWQRCAIAALLTVVDICTCLQDWEFPSFNTPTDFYIAGTWISEIDIKCLPQLLNYLHDSDFWEIFRFRMSGKWLAYLPAIGALGVDWWYLCRTIGSYNPLKVGEYTDPNCLVYVIRDTELLDSIYPGGALDYSYAGNISWDARAAFRCPSEGGDCQIDGRPGDVLIHARYCGTDNALSWSFIAIGLSAGFVFVVLLVWAEYYWDYFLRRHSREDQQDKLEERVASYLNKVIEQNQCNCRENSDDSESEYDSSVSEVRPPSTWP